MMRGAYCYNPNSVSVTPEHHNPQVPYSQYSFKKSFLGLIARRLAGRVSSLQQKTEAGNDKPNHPSTPEHATKACFFMPAYQWWLGRGTFMVAGNLMGPVLSSLLELPPLKMTIQTVVTLTHQRLPA